MAVEINPKKLRGPWVEGYALDVHTTGSDFLGYNAYGHPEFATKRTPIGDLIYRLKYRGDQQALEPIVESILSFLKVWKQRFDAIVSVPPSNTLRKNQPVIQIAQALSVRAGIELCESCISKIKGTAQLKDVFDREKRTDVLRGVFSVDDKKTRNKRLLLFDDLYRSGATVSTIARLLTDNGGAAAVYLLTLTQTRRSI